MSAPAENLSLFPEFVTFPGEAPFYFENRLSECGYRIIAGVDEVGRGPLAGPVVAAAVILPSGVRLDGVRDSKRMSERAREKAFSAIDREALACGIGVVSHRYIDEFNILKASLEAMRRAVLALEPRPEFLLVDGIHAVPVKIPQRCIKKGDQISKTISAGSVMAKVYRDRIMRSYHERYPVYGFDRNKGYGTPRHLHAIQRYGPSSLHRLTFKGAS